MTNEEFGNRVGCSPSMASRLRSGTRRPGADLRDRIVKEFNLEPDVVIEAYKTRRAFGALLRREVFNPPRLAA